MNGLAQDLRYAFRPLIVSFLFADDPRTWSAFVIKMGTLRTDFGTALGVLWVQYGTCRGGWNCEAPAHSSPSLRATLVRGNRALGCRRRA
jgi:hypothetical protein